MNSFALTDDELSRLSERLLRTGVEPDTLCPVCMASRDCNPKNYRKPECHGCNEIIALQE